MKNKLLLSIALLLTVVNIQLFGSDLGKEEELLPSSPTVVPKSAYMKVRFHNVGQGHCTTVSFLDPDNSSLYPEGKPLHMLYDCGSSSFVNEIALGKTIQARQNKAATDKKSSSSSSVDSTKLSAASSSFTSPSLGKKTQTMPKSTTKNDSPTFKMTHEDYKKDSKNANVIINSIRRSLKGLDKKIDKNFAKQHDIPMHIHLVIFSHPDSDHYRWATNLFRHPKDRIDTIILGGLPDHYDQGGTYKFRQLLERFHVSKTQIYFPALSFEPVSDLATIYQPNAEARISWESENSYAPHTWSHPMNGKLDASTRKPLFDNSLDFGEKFGLYFLSINPTHQTRTIIDYKTQKEPTTKVVRVSSPDSSNADSLALKLTHKDYAVILMGDATHETTGQITNNYAGYPDFLKSTFYNASHHGANSDGSNNFTWLKTVSPDYIFFSNGTFYNHPTSTTYINCGKVESLKCVKKHEVRVGEIVENVKKLENNAQDKAKYITHDTHRAIFATLDSGTLTSKFMLEQPIVIKAKRDNRVTDFIEMTEFPLVMDEIKQEIPKKRSSKKELGLLKKKQKSSSSTSKEI